MEQLTKGHSLNGYSDSDRREYLAKKEDEEKTAHANSMAARYRSFKSRFSGTSTPGDAMNPPELWKVALAKYQRYCAELGLSNEEKVSLMHNLFTGDAETYFFSNLDGIKNWGTLVETLNERYNSYAHQRGVLDSLRHLHNADFIKDDCHAAEALVQVAHQIEVLIPQAPRGNQSDQDKLEHLHRAVLGTEWSRAPISNLATTPRSYKQFFDELKTAEQSHRLEKKVAALKFGRASGRSSIVTQDVMGSSSNFFTDQARYGRDPTARHVARIDDSADNRCFNCGDRGDRALRCPKPRDNERIAREKFRWTARKGRNVTEVLKTVKQYYLNLAAHVNYLNCGSGNCFDTDDLDDAIDGLDDTAADAHHTEAVTGTAEFQSEGASLANALDSDEDF